MDILMGTSHPCLEDVPQASCYCCYVWHVHEHHVQHCCIEATLPKQLHVCEAIRAQHCLADEQATIYLPAFCRERERDVASKRHLIFAQHLVLQIGHLDTQTRVCGLWHAAAAPG